MHRKKRGLLLVDSEVQGAIVKRLLVYWASCMLFVTVSLTIVRTLAAPEQFLWEHFAETLQQYWPILTALTAILLDFKPIWTCCTRS